jgi:zinc/manganese transport system substrate-binding protein
MYMFKPLLLLFVLVPMVAQATLDVVATSSSTGMLVREIAGDQAKLEILAPPDRDVHYLQARPSMIRALRGADLVVALGAELEVGWLPIAIRQAANPKILPGRPGYFEAAAQVELLDTGGVADRALGDVHPVGNPHVNMDPVRMAQVGMALAERLGELDRTHAEEYQARAQAFEARVRDYLPKWQSQAAQAPGAVLYHKDAIYLLERFDVPLLGLIEPVPGVPPSGAHLKQLTDNLKGRQGVVLFTSYQPEQALEVLAAKLGWPKARLALEPPLNADGDAYLQHIDRWVEALVQGD